MAGMELRNRAREIGAIDSLLGGARAHAGGALVLRGEPGVGLTALLDHAAGEARDMCVLQVAGVDAEVDIPYGALHRLLAPEVWWRHRLHLPWAQRAALGEAFRFAAPGPGEPNALLVALGTLTLLARAAEDQPVLCTIDDAEQLDEHSANALAFAARRIGADGVAMLFARREPSAAREFLADLDELVVGGLDEAHARALIDAVFGHRLDPSVLEWILSETDGNPRAILGLPSVLPEPTTSVFAGPLPLARRMEEEFLQKLRALSPGAHEIILLAAVLHDGSVPLFWSAVAVLGLSKDAYREAEDTGLLKIGTRVSLRGSLLRSAVFGAAAPDARRRIHGALGEAANAAGDGVRAALHRAAASSEPDEALASALVAATTEARRRGGTRSVAALLERAGAFTPDPAVRAVRLLEGADAWLAAGSPGRAAALLAETAPLPLTELDRARAAKLHAQVAQMLGQAADSATLLLRAAQEIAVHDPRLGREALLEALEAAVYFSRLGSGGTVLQTAQAALELSTEETGTGPDLLLHGLAQLFTLGHEAALPTLRRALDVLQADANPRWLTLGGLVALELGDDAAFGALAATGAERPGASRLSPLSVSLGYLAGLEDLIVGRLAKAAGRHTDLRILADAVRDPTIGGVADAGSLMVWAWRGDPGVETRALIDRGARDAMAAEQGRYYALSRYALAVYENGLGGYEEALTAAQDAVEGRALYIATFALPELVEAAVRSGEREIAADALHELSARMLPSGTNWALGMLARSGALLAEGDEAELLYREAIERLGECRVVPQLARAHLLYGEWLRRRRRRRDAREHLRRAEGMFVAMSVEGFAARARGELQATGEHIGPRQPQPTDALTAQEARIAALVADASSNSAIAAQLFLSPRTIEYHLQKVYRKLGVTSRIELARTLMVSETPEHEPRSS
jgi:DNA-binding CsgD family transcriptional regulator